MRERLIELLDKAFLESDDNYGRPCTEQVASHLLAEGIIVPPCKVGDIVYEINRFDFESCKHCGENGDVCPHLYAEVGFGYKCENTRYGEKPLECSKIEVIKIEDITNIFHRWSVFGKTVFHTRSEAEQALAERSADDGT